MSLEPEETGECGEQELNHSEERAEKFYRDLKERGICARVGMEATGYSRSGVAPCKSFATVTPRIQNLWRHRSAAYGASRIRHHLRRS